MTDEVKENMSHGLQYARCVEAGVSGIESIPRCSGAAMHGGLSKPEKPVAIYKDVSDPNNSSVDQQ